MYESVDREKFLIERRKVIDWGKESGHITCDPGDLVVCDLCNEEVTDNTLYIDDGWLACPKCFQKEFQLTLAEGKA